MHRSPWARVLIQCVRPCGVVAHALHAVATDRRAHRRDTGLDGRRPPPGRHGVEHADGRGGPVLGVIAVAVGQVRMGGHQRERRVAGHLLVGEVTEPAADGRVVALRDVAEGVGPRQIAREPDVSRGRGMADRGVDVAVAGVPVARAPVELRPEVGLAPAQLGAQHLGQEPVVAVPLVGAIQGTTSALARARSRSRSAEPTSSSTASHSGPDRRAPTSAAGR